MLDPVVWRLSRSRCAFCASFRGYFLFTGVLTTPRATTSNRSFAVFGKASPLSALGCRGGGVVLSVGRVANSDPLVCRMLILKASIGPDAEPKLTNMPSGLIQSREAGNVALPTPS